MMRISHPRSRVSASIVYNEFIAERHHLHMNATRWYSLTEFVQHLGRTGQCKVEDTPKGWFITLIQRDEVKELADGKRGKREKREREDEERYMEMLQQQIERAKAARTEGDGETAVPDSEGAAAAAAELHRDGESAPVKIALAGVRREGGLGQSRLASVTFGDDIVGPSTSAAPQVPVSRPLSKLEQIMQADKARKETLAAKAAATQDRGGGSGAPIQRWDHWLVPGIIVKVMSRALESHGYYKAKARVEKVIDKYIGELTMLNSGDVVRVDQAELETVIPQPGSELSI
jgi:DNA/RNA-binding protein KIN17